MKFKDTNIEEQETIVSVDYCNKEINLYTSRQSVYNRLYKKLGEPTQTFLKDKKITGATWKVSFENKKLLSSILNRTCIIGRF